MAIGIWAGVSALALAIGPLLGGIITEHISWNWIFFVNVPIGVLAVIAAIVVVPESKDTSREQRLDLPGLVTLRHRPARARLRADRGEPVRLDVGSDPRPLRGRGGRARRLRAARDAPAAADARPLALPQRHLRRREHRRDPRDAGDVRDLRLLPDLHADLPRLVADPGRRGAAAVDADDRHLRADRREALRPRRLALADGRRDDRRRGSAACSSRTVTLHSTFWHMLPALHPRRARDVVRR